MNSLQGKSRGKPRLPGAVLFLLTSGIVAGTVPLVVSSSAARPAAAPQAMQGLPPPPAPRMPAPSGPQDSLDPLTSKQKRNLKKYRFNQMKEHADELAGLANSLQEDLGNSNENVLSLEIIEKASKIEKLAKKIRAEAKLGF